MYKLSNLAAEDFAAIYEYTLINFGASQADACTTHLESIFSYWPVRRTRVMSAHK